MAAEPGYSDAPIPDSLIKAVGDHQEALKGDANGGDWRERIPAEVKNEKFWENYKTESDAFKAHAELIKYRGRAAVLPGANATPEELADFRKKIGVPDKPDGYQLKLPSDANKEFVDAFLGKVAHAKGFTPEQAQAVADYWQNDIFPKLSQTPSEEDVTAAQKQRWGADYQKKCDSLDTFIRAEISEKCAEAIDNLPMEHQLEIADKFAELGTRTREGKALDVAKDQGGTTQSIQAMETRLAEIMSHPAFLDRSNMLHRSLVDERLQLTMKLGVMRKQ